MKILLVIDTYDTNNNGTSISAQRFAAVLREHGNEVRILTTGEPAPDKFVLKEFKVPLFNDLIHSQGFRKSIWTSSARRWHGRTSCIV